VGAWDVKVDAGGLAFSHRVLLLRRADAMVIDAVAFVRPGATPPPDYPVAVQDIQAAGLWLPANCGGVDCTYLSTPSAVDVSVDWTAATIRSGNSCRRGPGGVDVDSNADWSLGASSWGLPN